MTPPTAPGRLPLLGHALGLLRAPLTTLARARQLGEVVRLQLGPLPAYLVNSPELIQQILVRDSRRFDRGMLFDKASEVVGNGLVTSNGRLHRHHAQRPGPQGGPPPEPDPAAGYRLQSPAATDGGQRHQQLGLGEDVTDALVRAGPERQERLA